MNYYLLDQHRRPKGPYELSQLREYWKTGRIPVGTRCCEKGGKKWLPIEDVLGESSGGGEVKSSVVQSGLLQAGGCLVGIVLLMVLVGGNPLFPALLYLHFCRSLMEVLTKKEIPYDSAHLSFNSWQGWQKAIFLLALIGGECLIMTVSSIIE